MPRNWWPNTSTILKPVFPLKSVGYGKGQPVAHNANTRGIVDYWEDDEKQLESKSMDRQKYIAVLCVYSARSLPETRIDVFKQHEFSAN